VTQTSPLSSEEKAKLLLDTVEDRKAVDPVLLDLRGQTLMADFFLICSGTSNVHIRSIADAVLERADERDVNKPRVEGQQNAEWVLLDFGDVVLHVMAEEPRARYRLEQFWTTPQPKGALPPTPDSVAAADAQALDRQGLDGADARFAEIEDEDLENDDGDGMDDLDDDDLDDAAFFDEADQEVEPVDEEDDLDERPRAGGGSPGR
jgi:ribosome-associated protein